MRWVKILLTAAIAVTAVFAGLLIAAAVAIGGVAFFLVRRLLRSSRPAPLPGSVRRPPRGGGDAIDVTATEVPAEPPPRLN